MEILEISKFRYYLKHFGISYDKFVMYLNGNEGSQKQLFAFVFKSFDKSFLDSIIANKELIKLNGVKYLDEDSIVSFFGFRKFNIQNWTSQKRQNLKKSLLNTPECYVYHIKSNQMTLENLNSLFSKPQNYEPEYNTCSLCPHFNTCEGAKKLPKPE
jgi:hypothetical protein